MRGARKVGCTAEGSVRRRQSFLLRIRAPRVGQHHYMQIFGVEKGNGKEKRSVLREWTYLESPQGNLDDNTLERV